MPALSISSPDGASRRFAIEKDRVTIGRARDNDLFLPDQWLSRRHAEIRQGKEGYTVVDLGSKNGTLVNRARIAEERLLRSGDVITLGDHVITFASDEAPAAEPEAETEPFGTKVFSARTLQAASTDPALDAAALARQNRMLRVLSQSASALIEHRPLPEVFERVLDLLFEAVSAERGAVVLLEGNPAAPVIKASRVRSGPPVARVSRSISRRVLEERVSVLLPNLMQDAVFSAQESVAITGIRSALCAPLWLASPGTDSVIGLVYLDSKVLDKPFSEDDLAIVTALANVAAAKIENARLLEESLEKQRLEEDMRTAAAIQASLLPDRAPIIEGYGLEGSTRPCLGVGGDYYDFDVEDGQLLLALGDVSGKGTGAAILMAVLRAAVRGQWSDPVPSEAVARINRTICQNVPENKYVTFFMARLDPRSGRLTYVNAGHNPPLVVRAGGEVETLTEGGMVLGMFDSVPYADGTVELGPGDTLLVFSDGVTETWNARDEEFGETRLAEVAVRERGRGAGSLQAAILEALETHAEGGRASDDRTLIVLKRDAG